MELLYNKIDWGTEQLWKGCILAGLVHAIMVAHYPFIANEHSWDGQNYSVQDSSGQRGTVSFSQNCCVAAFRNDNSKRIEKMLKPEQFFVGASDEILKLANSEALQYLLDEVDGEIRPVITTAFWGKDLLFSNDSFDEMLLNGGNLLKYQALDVTAAIQLWKEFYDMSEKQLQLLKSIFNRKVYNYNNLIIMSIEEINMIGTGNQDNLNESKISFEEMGIHFKY